MIVLILFLCLTFIFWTKHKLDLEREFIYEYGSYIMGLSSVLIYAYLYMSEEKQTSFYYLFLIPCFVFLLYFIKQKIKAKPLNIEANQQRYFDEVDASMINEYYKSRKDIKSNRIEVSVNKESKKLMKNGKIVPEFFLLYHHLEPTMVKDINELKSNTIFAIIFKKLEEFIKLKEIKIDYEKELACNNHYLVEFFLMELWEKYTPQFNISVANLDILAKNEKEREFLGALDLIHLNCVKRKGAVFYYKYLEFKDRIKEYVKNEVSENPTNESGFDETYAKENDSDKTPYKTQN